MNGAGPEEGTVPNVVRWGVYSVAVNIVLAALHATIAAASGSVAVAAELMHNLVDLTSAGVVVVGLKLAMRKTAAFPYGLYKVENLVAAGIAVLIFLTAYEIVRDLLVETVAPPRVDAWMLVLLLATTAIPLAFSHFELRVGRTVGSPALVADAREYRIHAYTTGLAFAALLSAHFDLPLDRIAAVIIVAAVVKTGWDLLIDALRVLLDASLDHVSTPE
jgi:cation diffusion facilitator family transporter